MKRSYSGGSSSVTTTSKADKLLKEWRTFSNLRSNVGLLLGHPILFSTHVLYHGLSLSESRYC